MFNPQLMGLNNLDNVPTTKDLWKNEKHKYRHWMILFGVGLLVAFSLYLVGFIINMVDHDFILQKLIEQLKATPSKNPIGEADSIFLTRFIIFPSIVVSTLFISIILYVVTITKSYLQHSFARFSPWLIYIVSFGSLFSFIQIIMTLANVRLWMQFPGAIFIFITLILFIVFYFTTATRVSHIRKQFAYSEYIQKLKNDERFIKFQQSMQNSMGQANAFPGSQSNPFGPQIFNPQASTSEPNKTIDANVSLPIDIKMHKQYNKLQAMSLEKLKEIGKKMSISGMELMQKDELIETIIRVSKKD